MESNWPTVRLGDLIDVKHGWPFKSDLFSKQRSGKGIVVSIGNFRYTGGFRFEETDTKEYVGTYPTEYALQAGDVLLVMTCQTPGGEILGIPARIPDDGNLYLHNQRMGKVVVRRPDLVRLDYLYWLFLSRDFNRHLAATASGTKILHTAPTRICEYSFNLPPLTIQAEIAATLSAIDDRIDVLRLTNKTLEAIAEAIYKSWFINFEPVRAKAKGQEPDGIDPETAAAFPSEFHESEHEIIPKDWLIGTIKDVVSIHDSKRVPLSAQKREQRKGPYPYYGAAALMDHVDDFLFEGVHLLLGEDGSVIHADGTPVSQYVWGQFWVNNHAHVLRGANGVSTEHVMLAVKQMVISPYVTGAVQAKLNQANLFRIPFLIPSQPILAAFTHLIDPLFAKLRWNSDYASHLAALRDILLPRLISGQLRVPDSQEALAEALA